MTWRWVWGASGRAAWLLACGVTACLMAAASAGGGVAPPVAGQTEQLPRPSMGTWPTSEPAAAADRVLVRFKSNPQAAARAAAQARAPVVPGLQLARYAGRHHRQAVPPGSSGTLVAAAAGGSSSAGSVPADATMVFTITDGSAVQEKLKQLRAHPDVAVAEPDYKRLLYRLPNDPLFPSNSRYPGMWYLQRISAPGAWDSTTGSSSVKVCVIDSGLRSTHEDLAANVAGGWNRAVKPDGSQPVYGTAEYDNFTDIDGHGTHCAGSLGAAGSNGVGIAGVSWQVSLYSCKATSLPDATGTAYMYDSATLDCYALCGSVGARVVSASFGGYGFSSLARDAINELGQAGTVFVSSAGNDATDNNVSPAYPASYVTATDNIISVAATMPSDSLAPFSNWGSRSVHLAAPGVSILSTVPWSDSTYDYKSGTSMATPLTAGAVALLLATKPSATVAEVKSALLAGVDQIPDLKGRLVSGGRLNVQRALAKLLGSQLPPPSVQTYAYQKEPNTQYGFNFGWAKFALTNSSSCLNECSKLDWCYYAVSFSYVKTISKQDGNERVPAYWGRCLHVDMSAIVVSAISTPMADAAYKSPMPSSLVPQWPSLGNQPPLPPPSLM
ncbi:hypothetical protein ABPG77_010629 [Micractinium sp. CCAP 211/92]